jgi:Nucleotidyl transferase AbiEii toxin, Type IV TA system
VERDELLRVLKAFEDQGLEYVLIGATALAMHGIVRATEDVDFFIRATADNVERLKRALQSVYADDPSIEEIRAQDLLGEFPSIRYYPPTGDLYFDVLTRIGEAARYEDVAVETKLIAGIRVRVATPRALYDLKKGTVRALDRQDAEALRQRFLLEDP